MVNGAIKEALDLRCVKVNAHDAVCTSSLEEISYETSRDGLTSTALLVLAGVGVERGNNCDALGRCTLECINHDQGLHHPFVDGSSVRLNHEDISTTNAVVVTGIDFTVSKGAQVST